MVMKSHALSLNGLVGHRKGQARTGLVMRKTTLPATLNALVETKVREKMKLLEAQVADLVAARVQEAVQEALLKHGVVAPLLEEKNKKEEETVTPRASGVILGGPRFAGMNNLFLPLRRSLDIEDIEDIEDDIDDDIDIDAPVELADVQALRAIGMEIVSDMAEVSMCLEKDLFDPTKATIKNIQYFFDSCMEYVNMPTYQAFERRMYMWCDELSDLEDRCVATVTKSPGSSPKAGKAAWRAFARQKVFQ
jgi:hypothetical protein